LVVQEPGEDVSDDLDLVGKPFAGKHSSVEFKPAKLEHNLDPKDLGKGPAEALARAIGNGIKSISATSKDGHQMFNVTGRLANGIHATFDAAAGDFRIETPPDRALSRLQIDRLVELVPALSEPLDNPGMEVALVESLAILMQTKGAR